MHHSDSEVQLKIIIFFNVVVHTKTVQYESEQILPRNRLSFPPCLSHPRSGSTQDLPCFSNTSRTASLLCGFSIVVLQSLTVYVSLHFFSCLTLSLIDFIYFDFIYFTSLDISVKISTTFIYIHFEVRSSVPHMRLTFLTTGYFSIPCKCM